MNKNQNNPKTEHSKAKRDTNHPNTLVTLDNPDDRMTEQSGNGLSLVKNDNPDDVEDQLNK